MLIRVKNQTARILLAIAVTVLLAGAPIAVSSAYAAGGSNNGGGTVLPGGG